MDYSSFKKIVWGECWTWFLVQVVFGPFAELLLAALESYNNLLSRLSRAKTASIPSTGVSLPDEDLSEPLQRTLFHTPVKNDTSKEPRMRPTPLRHTLAQRNFMGATTEQESSDAESIHTPLGYESSTRSTRRRRKLFASPSVRTRNSPLVRLPASQRSVRMKSARATRTRNHQDTTILAPFVRLSKR